VTTRSPVLPGVEQTVKTHVSRVLAKLGLRDRTAPVGTAVTFHGTDILRVANDQVVEYWLNADTLDLMTQLQVSGQGSGGVITGAG
jgi:hypothetical protein